MADTKNKKVKLNWWQKAIPTLLLLGLLSIPINLYFNGGGPENRGQWGDFVGGTINPILTFVTFLALIYTIILQRNELTLSRRELKLTRKEVRKSAKALKKQNNTFKQQRFETTLFSMIGVFNQIIDQMDLEIKRGTHNNPRISTKKGRDCFSYINNILEGLVEGPGYQKKTKLADAYEGVYSKYASDLGHYFRVLYNIFKFIKESDYSNPIYAKILRAQLSNQELLILYYNCLSPYGEKFKELAIEFELFDNLQLDTLIRPEHYDLMDKKAFGNNQSALEEIESE